VADGKLKKNYKDEIITFQFDLPKELLAEFPSEHRDEARLILIVRNKLSNIKLSKMLLIILTMAMS
jgi:S-adenosylmethionine:tRNA-ribosyltransferase-isomerase (queuine synthetase)